MVNRFAGLRGLVVLTSVSIFSTVTWAAGFEVSGFGGGMTMDSGVGTNAIYGATGSVRLGDNLHLFGEFSHATILSELVSGVSASGKVSNYGGGADVSFRSPDAKVRPYLTAGLGVGHFYVTGSGSSNGVSANVSATLDNALYEQIGGGVRVHLGKWLGLKPEVRYVHYNSSTSSLLGMGVASINGVQYTVGVFFGKQHCAASDLLWRRWEIALSSCAA